MIQCEFKVCSLDEKPIEESHVYKAVRRFFGKRFADRLVYVKVVPPDSDAG